MAGCLAFEHNLNQNNVLITVGLHFDHDKTVAAGFAFAPQTLTGPAPEVGFSFLKGKPKRFDIHMSNHKHGPVTNIRDNCCYEAIGAEPWRELRSLFQIGFV